MIDILRIALAAWAVAWAVSLWGRTEGLRAWLSIWYELDNSGEPVGRWGNGGLGEWINCPMCALLLAVVPVAVLQWLWPPAVTVLASVGLGVLVVRWFEGARVKARWWE